MTDWRREHDAELGLRKEWSARAQKAEAEVEQMRAALKPIVKARASIDVGDLSGALSVITLTDLRRAANVFNVEQSKAHP